MRFQMSAWLKGIRSIRAPSCWKRHLGCPVWPCLCPSMPPLKHFHGTSVPQNMAPSQRLHVRMWSYVLFMCYVWLEAAPLAWRADSRLRCWTSVSLLRPTEASWKCSTQRWSRAQWLSAQLPRPQLAPRPGTPGSVACYPSDPLIWIWRWIGPEGRESSSKDSRLLSLLVF